MLVVALIVSWLALGVAVGTIVFVVKMENRIGVNLVANTSNALSNWAAQFGSHIEQVIEAKFVAATQIVEEVEGKIVKKVTGK